MRFSQQIGRVLALLAVLLFARAGYATPIAYDEAVSGDLPSHLPFTQFTLDVGSNTVKGTEGGLANTIGDSDAFVFVVPLGMRVTDIRYAFTPTSFGDITSPEITYVMANGNKGQGSPPPVGPPLLGELFITDFGVSPQHMSSASFPLGAGTYTIEDFSLGFGCLVCDGAGFFVNYTWTLDVVRDTAAAVPEPASMFLLGTGLIGMGTRRWRNRRQH